MEKVIIGQSANGKSIANIAEYLSVSITTIKTHRTNIFKKLGVSNITEAIQYVEDYNLIWVLSPKYRIRQKLISKSGFVGFSTEDIRIEMSSNYK